MPAQTLNLVKEMSNILYSAIIVAGGKGNRMQALEAKQYMPLNGKPVFVYSVEHYIDAQVEEIILVVPEGDEDKVKAIIENEVEPDRRNLVQLKIVVGGDNRLCSVYNGIKASSGEYVLIHDAARPMTDVEDIKTVMNKVIKGACLLGHMAVDTIEVVKDGIIEKTLNRAELFVAGTPQAFKREEIENAYSQLFNFGNIDGFTDDVSVYRYFIGKDVYAIMETKANLKLTYRQDVDIAETLLRR